MTVKSHLSFAEQIHSNAPKSWEMEVFQNVQILNKRENVQILNKRVKFPIKS